MKKQIEGFEFLEVNEDAETGAKTFIAVHSNALGPALGGIRMFHYKTNSYGMTPEKAAEIDALRLAKAMTYKASIAGLSLGGGKSVILADPSLLLEKERRELFERFGKTINSLEGKYIAAEDIGTNEYDMANTRNTTQFVTGVPGEAGDPSPVTAFGVFRGMEACCLQIFGTQSLKNKTIALQGTGNVGLSLLPYLKKAGATLVVADTNKERANKAKTMFDAKVVEPDEIYDVDCDIFSPNAFGEVINKKTVKRLKCKIVAGAANNQLASPEMGKVLHFLDIIYAPDFVINCGGLISVANEKVVTNSPYNFEEVMQRTDQTFDRVLNVLERSSEENQPTHEIAEKIAEERIDRETKVHPIPVGFHALMNRNPVLQKIRRAVF